MVTLDIIRKVKEKGYEYHVWTVDDVKTAKRFREWGAESTPQTSPTASGRVWPRDRKLLRLKSAYEYTLFKLIAETAARRGIPVALGRQQGGTHEARMRMSGGAGDSRGFDQDVKMIKAAK